MPTLDDRFRDLGEHLAARPAQPSVRDVFARARRQRRRTAAGWGAAVAVTVASVVAGFALVGPSRPTSLTQVPTATPSPSPRPTAPAHHTDRAVLQGTRWSTVRYPLSCGSFGYRPLQEAYVDLDQESALVLVRCDAGAGTPPVGLFRYVVDSSRRVRLAETLLPVRQSRVLDYQGSSFALSGTTVTLTGYAFSSATVPDCCPDVRRTLVWTWTGRHYTRAG